MACHVCNNIGILQDQCELCGREMCPHNFFHPDGSQCSQMVFLEGADTMLGYGAQWCNECVEKHLETFTALFHDVARDVKSRIDRFSIGIG